MRYRSLSEAGAAGGAPDVRGWVVRDARDRRVGTVADVLLGEDGAVRYLDVKAGGFLDPVRVLLPIGVAALDPKRETLRTHAMRNEEIRALPEYRGDPSWIDDDFEGRLRLAIPPAAGGDIYSTRHLRFASGAADLEGAADLDAAAPVEEGVAPELAAAPAPAAPAEPGVEEIRVPIVEEELVVERRPVVREEVVIRKRVVQDTQTVEADVRKEVVDVREHGRTR